MPAIDQVAGVCGGGFSRGGGFGVALCFPVAVSRPTDGKERSFNVPSISREKTLKFCRAGKNRPVPPRV